MCAFPDTEAPSSEGAGSHNHRLIPFLCKGDNVDFPVIPPLDITPAIARR
jgi:hypothetical protein